jgi:hypothetical protein
MTVRRKPPPLRARGLCVLGALLAPVTTAVAQPGMAPAFDVQIDGCVLPGKDCDPADEVIRSGGWVRDEMRRRPLRAFGPDEVLAGLRPGARVRLLATLRLNEGLVLVRSVIPAERPRGDDPPPPAQESPR